MLLIYSDENARERFYLCKILDVRTAEETVQDNYDHYIEKDTKYLICNYFEKVKERRGMVQYQLLDGEVFVHPYQVAVPFVGMSDKHCLTVAEYQFIADCVHISFVFILWHIIFSLFRLLKSYFFIYDKFMHKLFLIFADFLHG